MSNPYQASAAEEKEPVEDEALGVPLVATLGGFAVIGAGLFTAVAGLQLASLVSVYAMWAKPIPYLLMLLGVAAMGTGGMLTRGRFWASVLGTGLCLMSAFLGAFWTIWAIWNGFFALLTPLAAFVAFFAGMLTPFAIPATLKLSRARARLFAD